MSNLFLLHNRTISENVPCCNLDGLRELIDISIGISINNNKQNYTCVTPDNIHKVMEIDSNEDP
eukprot:Awhi_evm2s3836